MSELRRKTVRGSMLSGGVALLIRPLNIVTTILVARILDPSDFGSVKLAIIFASSMYLFLDLGMAPALVQTRSDRGRAAFQTFLVASMTGMAVMLVSLVYAEPIAAFLGDPSIVPIIRWLSLSILMVSIRSVPWALLQRDLHFGRLSTANLLEESVNMAVSVTLAYLGFGVWSLVYAYVISSIVKTIAIWLFCPGWVWLKPTEWDWSISRELFGYGGKSTLNGIISYFHSNWDDWLVGRVLGTTSLGYYSKAYDLSNQTLASLSRSMINTVFFPSYARIRDDKRRLTRAYLKSLHFVVLLMTPVALGMAVVAPELVDVLLGQKWLPMIPILQIYSVMVLTRPISSNTYPLFNALGLPGYNVRAGVLLAFVMVPLALYGIRWGAVGVACAVVTAHFVAASYNIYQVNRLLPGTAQQTLRALAPPFIAGGAMAAVVMLVKGPLTEMAGGEQNLVTLFAMVGIGAAVYLSLAFFLERKLILEVFGALGDAINIKKLRSKPAAN